MQSRAEKLQQIFGQDAVFSAFNTQSHQTLMQHVKYLRFFTTATDLALSAENGGYLCAVVWTDADWLAAQ